MASYLDISPVHISESTSVLLEKAAEGNTLDCKWPAMTIAGYAYGFFITIPADMTSTENVELLKNMPPDIVEVLKYTNTNEHTLVRLDADGEPIEDLPSYHWG